MLRTRRRRRFSRVDRALRDDQIGPDRAREQVKPTVEIFVA